MTYHDEPPVIGELMEWCLKRPASQVGRSQRVPRLFHEFRDLINGKIPIVTVAGTSGKGTTCALLEAMLIEAGHVTGVYTKPHLNAFRERFRVAGREVPDSELASHARSIRERLQAFVDCYGQDFRPTLYEALVLIAASIFTHRGVTLAVFEAAVGGRSCATSYLPSILSVLTSVDLDHQLELGSTIEEIARDKAGIAPPGGVLVVGAGVGPAARPIVLAECATRHTRCVQADLVETDEPLTNGAGQIVRFSLEGSMRSVFIAFPGRHQALNFASVLAATKLLYNMKLIPSMEAIRGVEGARSPGRFEFVRGELSWLLDVAHNPASIASLIDTASRSLRNDRLVGIVGATERHDYRTIVNLLAQWGIPLGFCEGYPRAISAHRLLIEGGPCGDVLGLFRSPAHAVEHCLSTASLAGSTVLVTGSLFLVGQCRQELIRRGIIR